MNQASAATRFFGPLGHDVRSDTWAQQGRSSYALAKVAVEEGRTADAVALARMTVQEAQEAFDLYAMWLVQLPELLRQRGVPVGPLAEASGRAWEVRERLVEGWSHYTSSIDTFADRAGSDTSAAVAELERARITWQAVHDPATDCLSSLFALAATSLGETTIGSLWDTLLGDYYDGIAAKYDPSAQPWSATIERLALDIFEAVRGHLTGPGRDGRFEVHEEDDRWVLQFAPCGSGGRTYPGVGDVTRDDAEFTTEEHDWAWRTKGVCLYCVHCCQLQQRAPIERIGIPLRVIEPPVRASAETPGRSVCTWSIYKDPAATPAHAFTDVGAVPRG